MDGWMNTRWMDGWVFKQTIITKLSIALPLASLQTCLDDNKTKGTFARNFWKTSAFLKSKWHFSKMFVTFINSVMTLNLSVSPNTRLQWWIIPDYSVFLLWELTLWTTDTVSAVT